MRGTFHLIATGLVAGAVACSMSTYADVSSSIPDGSDTDAVRGKSVYVSQAEIDLLYEAQPDISKIDEDSQLVTRAQVREILLQRALLERGALEAALEESERVQLELEAARQLVLADAYERHLAAPELVTEQEIDEEYSAAIEQLRDTEYEMRRMSFRDEATAFKAIQALKDNQEFEDVLKEYAAFTPNITPTDWRWISSNRMPSSVREEVMRISDNPELDPVPVKVEKTWIVVQVNAKRQAALPEKSDIETLLREKVAQSKVHRWLNDRRVAEGL